MNWVDKLIIEYEQGRKDLRKQHDELGDTKNDRADKKMINSMIADMSFVLEWMETGSEPDTFNGIDRRNVYQHALFDDMDIFQSVDIEPNRGITEEEKVIIIKCLSKLSARERQCFVLYEALLWKQEEIAQELGIKRITVQTTLDRVRKKLKNEL